MDDPTFSKLKSRVFILVESSPLIRDEDLVDYYTILTHDLNDDLSVVILPSNVFNSYSETSHVGVLPDDNKLPIDLRICC